MNSIQFTPFQIQKMAIHQIFIRDPDRRDPIYGKELIVLDERAKEIFIHRVQESLANDSKCMKMQVSKIDEGSFFNITNSIISANSDDEFLEQSKKYANLLTDSQISRSIPGGLLIIFSGIVSPYGLKYLGALKAESQEGFTSQIGENGPTLTLMDNLFLTPTAKMYKLGIYVENNSQEILNEYTKFTPYVYDSLMSRKSNENGAIYFYDGFLGCKFPKNAAQQTRKFFELTKKFILENSRFSDEEKYTYFADLQSYLRTPDTQIHVSTFADRHIASAQDRDAYFNYMRQQDFPTIAVLKDTHDIINQLKKRKIKFGSSINLSGPADQMDKLVEIKEIDSPPNDNGIINKWTQIIIKTTINGTT